MAAPRKPRERPDRAQTASPPPAPRPATVAAAVEAEIATIAKRAPGAASSSMAALALAMAREVDKPRNSAASKAACAGKLTDAMEKLRALVPAEKTTDRVDDLAARRTKRLAPRVRAAK